MQGYTDDQAFLIRINVKWERRSQWEYNHKISWGYPFKDPLYTHEYMYFIFNIGKLNLAKKN